MITTSETRTANTGTLGRAIAATWAALREAAGALRQWLRGATDGQKYDSYLRHAAKCGEQPLTEREFYLDDQKRKYSRPSRCC